MVVQATVDLNTFETDTLRAALVKLRFESLLFHLLCGLHLASKEIATYTGDGCS